LLGLAACAVSAIAGCTLVNDDGGVFDAAAEPWINADAEWMQGRGTPLSYGVEVPEGARLVGPVFTKLSVWPGVHPPEQIALLLVDGDPYAVGRAFTRQWDVNEQPSCEQIYRTPKGAEQDAPYTGTTVDDALRIECGFALRIGWWQFKHQGQLGSLGVWYTTDLTVPGAVTQGSVTWESAPRDFPKALPPAPDGVVGPGTVDGGEAGDLDILDGSYLAGPPTTDGMGYTAVIGVAGDPDEVFDAYVAQDPMNADFTEDRVLGGVRIRQHHSNDAGGVERSITMNEKDGNAWILITAWMD
jgi:hypothetical protein